MNTIFHLKINIDTMLICKNCFTENADATVRCIQCNMEGNFSYKAPEGIQQDLWKGDQTQDQCVNCGSESPGKGTACVHCHFPMVPNKKENLSAFHNGELMSLKTG